MTAHNRSRDTVPFRYPPAKTSAEKTCYAPLCELGMGTGTAAVIDHRSGRKVHFSTPSIKIVDGVACVACVSTAFVDGVHMAQLPDGTPVWVRDVRDVFAAAAAGSAVDVAGGASGGSAA